jgi:hypothetical protein
MPPVVAGFRDQDKRKDHSGPWTGIHVIPHVPHSPPAGDPTVPAAAVRPPAFKVPATRLSPAVAEGAGRNLSRWTGGGILAGIGGAIAAALRGIFGRNKES